METQLPQDLQILLNKERIEEYIHTPREKPLSTCIALIIFWVFWCLVVYWFFGQMPIYMLVILYGIGIVFSWLGIYDLFAPWSYFVITKYKLIKYRKWDIKQRTWDSFTGKIELKWKNVVIELKSWTITHSRTTKKEIFTNDQVFIPGIDNTQNIFSNIKSKLWWITN